MGKSQRPWSVDRRTILKTSATIAAVQLTSPFIIKARGETPVRIGMVDPITGVYAALAQGEVVGAKFATEEINKKGGILGRPVELLVEDSANDVGTGVQKTRKLIERDQASFIIGDVNSGIALAMAQVTSEKKILHIVSGGHTDVITGTGCSWNMRSFWGPLLGATVFVVLQDYLSSVTVNWMSFVGLLFVLVVLFFPRGLLGFFQRNKACFPTSARAPTISAARSTPSRSVPRGPSRSRRRGGCPRRLRPGGNSRRPVPLRNSCFRMMARR